MVASLVLAAEKFWILDPLYNVLGALLAWFYGIIPSYGVSIVLLTVAVRIVTLPLTIKQARSQQKMQALQPELKRLQAKHKGDRQKLNEEMMRFYKEQKVNPLGGCLPLLIQMPILIVLYRLILDLSAQPPKHVPKSSDLYQSLVESGGKMLSWGMDLAKSASTVSGADQIPYLILIAVVVATGYYQQRQLSSRMPKDGINSQMQMIGKIFPIFFGVISFTIPAGVVVYFAASNLWQIGQQAVMFRNQPPIAAPPPDKGGARQAKKGSGQAKKSLGPGKKPANQAGRGAQTGDKRAPGGKRPVQGGKRADGKSKRSSNGDGRQQAQRNGPGGKSDAGKNVRGSGQTNSSTNQAGRKGSRRRGGQPQGGSGGAGGGNGPGKDDT